MYIKIFTYFWEFSKIKTFPKLGKMPKLAQTPVKNCWVKKSQKETPIHLTF